MHHNTSTNMTYSAADLSIFARIASPGAYISQPTGDFTTEINRPGKLGKFQDLVNSSDAASLKRLHCSRTVLQMHVNK
jgi:hypothetical protein